VPVVTLELSALHPVPGRRWQMSLALANNTERVIDARMGCTFRNGDRDVAATTVVMRGLQPGDKLGVPVAGPRVKAFVDNALCHVVSPLQ
jgi:hypothetical protein